MGSDVTYVTDGRNRTCALVDTGGIRCWGRGANGELGIPGIDSWYGNEPGETPAAAGDIEVF